MNFEMDFLHLATNASFSYWAIAIGVASIVFIIVSFLFVIILFLSLLFSCVFSPTGEPVFVVSDAKIGRFETKAKVLRFFLYKLARQKTEEATNKKNGKKTVAKGNNQRNLGLVDAL